MSSLDRCNVKPRTILAVAIVGTTPAFLNAYGQATNPAPEAGTAMQLSAAECNVFAGISMDVMKSIGRANLSDDFVHAMIDFAVNRKCTGPYSIPARDQDIDAFGAIDGILGSNKIMLDRIGVRSVKPVAAPTQN